MGERLASLSKDIQVLAITHTPQVASWGTSHFLVQKDLDATLTYVDKLNNDQRVEEIARMLSGSSITDEARSAAQKLLEAY